MTLQEFFENAPLARQEPLEEVVTEVFQDLILSVPETQDTPAPKGRAVDVNRFLSWLDDQDVFASPFGKRRFLDDIREGSFPTPPSHQQLRRLKLGRHVIWATVREAGVCLDRARALSHLDPRQALESLESSWALIQERLDAFEKTKAHVLRARLRLEVEDDAKGGPSTTHRQPSASIASATWIRGGLAKPRRF